MDTGEDTGSRNTEIEHAFYNDGFTLASNVFKTKEGTEGLYTAVSRLYDVLEEFMAVFVSGASKSNKPVACAKGCAWCCHQAVFAQSYEYRYLRKWLFENLDAGQLEDIRKRARDKVQNTTALSPDKYLQHKEACPLLVDNVCIAYEARPVACRIYVSQYVGECKHEFYHPDDASSFPGLFDLPLRLGRKLNQGFAEFLRKSGFETGELPFEAGILR